jgi:hypothetical protein
MLTNRVEGRGTEAADADYVTVRELSNASGITKLRQYNAIQIYPKDTQH